MLPLIASLALAQDAISLNAVRTAVVGESPPSLTFDATVDGSIAARFTCGPKSYSASEAVHPGSSVKVELTGLPIGTHRCSGSLDLQTADGQTGEAPIGFDVTLLSKNTLAVPNETFDLPHRKFVLVADRPIQRVEVTVFQPDGQVYDDQSASPSTRVDVTIPGTGEALRVEVVAWDTYGFPAGIELRPWSYAIPHEDVIFATDQSAITDAEAPKLDKAWADLDAVLKKYGSIVEVQLFVGGYTDTQGDGAHNQTLSEARAKAIATWFRAKGFTGPIFYQGFGESAPAVSTGDGVDEPRNRRAMYVLAAERPQSSGDFPRSAWRAL